MCSECTGPLPGGGPDPRAIDRRTFLKFAAAGVAGTALLGASGDVLARQDRPNGRLVAEFERAAREWDVPAEVLMAMGWVNTRWQMPSPEANRYRRGDIHGWGSYGVMALVQNPSEDTLREASRLTRIPEATLKTDRAANIRGGAALLAASAGRNKPREAADFVEEVAGRANRFGAVAGVGSEDLYARELLQALEDDLPRKLRAGEEIEVGARHLSRNLPLEDRSTAAVRRKPRVKWYPAHPSNYTKANRPSSHRIGRIVIHVTQGRYDAAIDWFQNPISNVSAHYVIRSRDGRIFQCLSDLNIGWHAGNWAVNRNSIGIEHEAYMNEKRWYTPELYDSSARLVAYLCRRYRIPVNRRRIIGHNQASNTPCPGRYWWWNYYMRRVRRYAGRRRRR